MADAQFVAVLIEKISAPAKKAMSALSGLTDVMGGASKSAEHVSKSTALMAHAVEGAIHHVEGLSAAFFGFMYFADGSFKREWAQNMHNLGNEVHIFTGKLKYGALAGAAYATALAHGVWKMAMYGDSARRTMTNLTGSEALGGKAFADTTVLATDLGMGIETTMDSMKELLAMQFKLPQATELIKLAADIRDVTGDASAAERALSAITTIKAKGKLQATQLTGQLAPAGLSTQLVMEELSKHYGKDIPAVWKMLHKGLIEADPAIDAIKHAIMRKLHEKAPGDAAKGYANSTLTGLMDQVHQAPDKFFMRVALAAQGSLSKLAPVVKDIVDTIKNIPTEQFAIFIDYLIQIGKVAVTISKEFFLGFIDGAKAINEAVGNLDPGANAANLAHMIGQLLAEAAAAVVWIVSKLARIPVFLNDHRWIVWLAVGLYTFKEIYAIAFMLAHVVAAIGGFMWLWGAIQGRIVVGGFAKMAIEAIKLALGLEWVQGLLAGIRASMISYYVTGPLMIMGWMALIVGGLVLIYMYWDDIVAGIKRGIDEIFRKFNELWRSFEAFLKALGSGALWTEAGTAAGKAFWKAFWDVANLANPLAFLRPGDKAEAAGIARLMGKSPDGTVVDNRDAATKGLFSLDDTKPVAQNPMASPSDFLASLKSNAFNAAQLSGRSGDVHVENLNVSVEGGDHKPAEETAADIAIAARKAVERSWSGMSAEAGGG